MPVRSAGSYDPGVAGTLKEIREEARAVLGGRSGIADGVVPPLVFVAVNLSGSVALAAATGMVTALAIVAVRLAGRRPLRFAFSGLAGTALAAVLATRSGRAETYFLPGLVSGAATTVVLLLSIAVRRPAVAYTSWVTRGWPLAWYWHDRVRPAYTATTWLWATFFGIRTAVQTRIYLTGDVGTLGVVRVLTGWPALLLLLAATYVIGRRRLVRLAGPSVEEFRRDDPPPWSGQERGF
jgi:hypothetical protein